MYKISHGLMLSRWVSGSEQKHQFDVSRGNMNVDVSPKGYGTELLESRGGGGILGTILHFLFTNIWTRSYIVGETFPASKSVKIRKSSITFVNYEHVIRNTKTRKKIMKVLNGPIL